MQNTIQEIASVQDSLEDWSHVGTQNLLDALDILEDSDSDGYALDQSIEEIDSTINRIEEAGSLLSSSVSQLEYAKQEIAEERDRRWQKEEENDEA